jgi:membrane-bound metal-dependent hydrolase YbcI (DUF457 family)
MLHTIRLGADLWRQYAIRFDTQVGEIAVRIGPIVNTNQSPLPGSEPLPLSSPSMEGRETWAWARVGVPVLGGYEGEIKIDIFTGPSFKFERHADQLYVHFLDFHRRWSHSLTLAAVLGLGTVGMAVLIELLSRGVLTRMPLWAGLVVSLGLVGHVLEDQLGHMGCNLFYPLTKGRSAGLRLLHSGDAIPNFLTVWTGLALILFNMDRFSAYPLLTPWWFLGLMVGLPLVVLGGVYQWQRRRGKPEEREDLQQWDIVSETEEVETG